jgi:hypothetical protein
MKLLSSIRRKINVSFPVIFGWLEGVRKSAVLMFCVGLFTSFPVLAQTNCVTKPAGLVGWWPGDGFALDVAGTNNGTFQGGVAYGSGEAGQAFALNGASRYVQIPDSPLWAFGSGDFSVELWANFADATGSRVLVASDQGPGTQNKWIFWLNGGVLQFHINGAAANVLIGTAAFAPALNQWYHLAVTRQGSTYTFFVNGSAVSSNTDNHAVPDANGPLTLGQAEGLYFFNGLLDEVSIYNRALSAGEVGSIVAGGAAGKCFTNDPAPVFVQQPTSVSGHAGSSVALSGAAMGRPRPAYQWWQGGSPIPGATSATLSFPNLSLADAGTYALVATNLFGARQSQSAVVTVLVETNCVTKPAGLVGWWPGDGFALDVAGTNNGTFQGGASYGVGEAGPAFSLDGVSRYVQIPDSPLWAFGSGDFSIELWANFADASGSRVLVASDQGPGTQSKWIFWLNGGLLQFHINGAASALIGSGAFAPALNQWYHLAVTREGSTYTFFVNGSAISSSSDSHAVPDANGPVTLGQAEGLFFFNGLLDEVSIYNRALSAGEVSAISAGGAAGKCFTNDPAPVFVQQPASVSGHAGSSVVLSGAAMGRPRPAYQWWQGGSPVPGATSATLSFPNLSLADAGTYVLVATNLFGASQSQPATLSVDPHEVPGPSSRKTGIVISEIMYKPAPRADTNNLEFVELYNSNPFFHDLSGYQIVGDNLHYTFPPNTTFAGSAFIVVAASPGSMQNVYGLANTYGPYAGSLKRSGTLQLLDEQGAVLLTVPYSNLYPWPVAADGTGHSLVLARPTYGEGDSRAWDTSDLVGGSPGALDVFGPSPLRNVVINEFLAHTENGNVPDFVELYNHSSKTSDLSGCILTDDPATNKFILPPGTLISPRGFVSFDQAQLGFGLSAAGETLYLLQPDGLRVLDAVQFEAQADGVSFGRWPDGANAFYPLASRTRGTNNSGVSMRDIVINELMYDPISGNDDDQYIELYNKGTNLVSLANWQFTSGLTFNFPTNSTLGPDRYLVIARNLTNLLAKYPNLNQGNTVGNFGGKLSHSGERVALAMPQELTGTNSHGPVTNTIYVVEDEVSYGTGGRWGQWAAGGGSSLELVDPHANHRLAANWADSDETQKSQWVNIETTSVLDNGQNFDPSIDYAQIGLLDAGECLVDNLEVHAGNSGPNYVANSDFESGLANWSLQGCQVRSGLENTGYGGSGHSLHIRCSDRMWTGGNSCQVALNANSLAAGQTATLRFKARWLHGWPEVLLRLNGNWLEATGAMAIPPNLGTPGARNSRYLANNGPAIYEVTHTPAVPPANQPVIVTASVHDPDGVQTLTLNYRLDPATTYTAVTMKDDGTGGDAVAGDGIFSASIPGQNANRIAAFYLSATDGSSAGTRFPALLNDNAPVRECVVMFGDSNPEGSFGVYHLWITQTNATRWSSLPNLSNESHDCTIVNGNRVIYNAQGRFSGSPYHQIYDTPTGSLCHYKWTFPEDDKFLGATSFNKVHQPGNGPGDDGSLQREQLANSFLRALGVPWLYKRYVAVYVNGNRRGILMEDTQTPDGDVVKEHFPNDSGGFLYKMQPWFEFAPSSSGGAISFNKISWCNLMPYTTTGGVKKVARYRYNFETRRTPDSASNLTNAFSLIDAANSYGTANYVANMENLADMENWMRVFAANHAAANQDAFGCLTAQNLYGYIGAEGVKYSLLMWDFNEVFDHDEWGPGQNLFVVNGEDPNTAHIYSSPTFRRMYWRALKELVNGPLNVFKSGPLMDAKYNAFVASGLGVEDPGSSIKPWLSQAHDSIASQIAAEDTLNFGVSATVLVSNNVAYVTGTAPVGVKTVWLNGAEWPLIWTSVTGWQVKVPLEPGTNSFSVMAVDVHGQPMAGTSNSVAAVYNGVMQPPAGQVVINEIMYQPAMPDGQYVELYNTSSNLTFDLSGWQVRGLSYTFPAGSLIGANSFLVLAANRTAFAGAYGATIPVFDTFAGTLQAGGESLSLVQPGTNGDLVVAQVRYASEIPWPAGAKGTGSSLQLIDPTKDNWRAGNWAANFPPISASPGVTNTDQTNLPAFPSLWLNELEPDNLTGITNSAGQRAAWLELYNPSTAVVSLNGIYLANNYTNLTNWAFPAGAVINPGQFKIIFADGQTNLSNLNELHTSFTLASGAGALALTRLYSGLPQVLDYINYTNLGANRSWGSYPDGQSFERQEFFYVTAGGTNNGTSAPLTVTINEWMAGNTHTLPDPLDGNKFDDWFELYNYGTNTVNLAGYYLTHSLTNQFEFQIPSGNSIPPHGFLFVWADKKTPTGSGDLHVNFKLSKSGTSIGLYGLDGNPVDYVSFGAQTSDISQGRYPDGSANMVFMITATPHTNNLFNTAPVLAAISNKVVTLGQTVAFTAAATDTDQPPQILTYSLGAGAPSGAGVNSTSGLFSWTPITAPSTNLLSLIVSDNGIPSLSATQTFTVTVSPPPQLGNFSLNGGQFTFSWPTIAGQVFQVEYKDDLNAADWIPVGNPMVGAGGALIFTNQFSVPEGFYRLRIAP